MFGACLQDITTSLRTRVISSSLRRAWRSAHIQLSHFVCTCDHRSMNIRSLSHIYTLPTRSSTLLDSALMSFGKPPAIRLCIWSIATSALEPISVRLMDRASQVETNSSISSVGCSPEEGSRQQDLAGNTARQDHVKLQRFMLCAQLPRWN